MPPVQLKNTLYGKHRRDPEEPAPKVVFPWYDEPVDDWDTDSSPKDIESTQSPEPSFYERAKAAVKKSIKPPED